MTIVPEQLRQRATRIVGIGGGTGLPVLLSGLNQLSQILIQQGGEEIVPSAVVCVSDNGGSSGRLRGAFGIPAVGDLRNCLVALSRGQPTLRDLFQHRLPENGDLAAHCLGNLLLAALIARSGSLVSAVRSAAEVLNVKGHVMPSTEAPATLCAEFRDGGVARGETEIVSRRSRIRRLWLEPDDIAPAPGVIEALATADTIVIGPGSLYTSIIPNLLLSGVAEALRASPALKVLVSNLTTEPGETDGFRASDHLRVLAGILGSSTIQVCLLNRRALQPEVASRYKKAGCEVVENDPEDVARAGTLPVSTDLLADSETVARHDPLRLAQTVMALTQSDPRRLGEYPSLDRWPRSERYAVCCRSEAC